MERDAYLHQQSMNNLRFNESANCTDDEAWEIPSNLDCNQPISLFDFDKNNASNLPQNWLQKQPKKE